MLGLSQYTPTGFRLVAGLYYVGRPGSGTVPWSDQRCRTQDSGFIVEHIRQRCLVKASLALCPLAQIVTDDLYAVS